MLNFGIILSKQSVIAFLVFYYVDVKHLPASWGAVVFGLFSVLNALNSLLFGYISDRTRTRWGRRIPYLRFLVIPLCLIFALIWFAPFDGRIQKESLLVYFVIISTCWAGISVLYSTAYYALFSEMFPNFEERTDVNTLKGMLGISGLLLGVALPPILYSNLGWPWMGIIFAVILLIGFAFGSQNLFENHNEQETSQNNILHDLKETFSNRNFVLVAIQRTLWEFSATVLSGNAAFYIKYSLGESDGLTSIFLAVMFISAVPFLFVWKKITLRIKTRNSMILGSILNGFASLLLFFVKDITGALLVAVLIGFGVSNFFAIADTIVAEVIDEDTRKTGQRREGLIWGNIYFMAGFNMVLASLVFGLITTACGYDSSLALQPDSVGLGFRILIGICPLAAGLLSAVVLSFYPKYQSE